MGRKHTRGGRLCSEILNLHLQSKDGCEREVKVNLEEIWSSGALFLTDERIRPFTSLWFAARCILVTLSPAYALSFRAPETAVSGLRG